MVARMVRDHEAMGSNPVTPTRKKGFERDVKKTAQCAVFSPRRVNRVSGAKKGA